MKIRKGFVSNSSSSSFIVIEHGILSEQEQVDTLIVDNDFGSTDFGWDIHSYHDTESKIIFCYLQVLDTKEPTRDIMLNLLENVIKEQYGCDDIDWDVDGYIDHASSAVEGENIEMFDGVNELKQFLFCDESYIHTHTDNDNY